METYDIDIGACRGRQRRLIEVMQDVGLEVVVVTQVEHVQWLAGPRYDWLFQPVAALTCEGALYLVCPQKPPETAAADEFIPYQAKWHSTLRNDQRQESSRVLIQHLKDITRGRRLGVEFSSFGQHLLGLGASEYLDVEPHLYQLRRRKDADELARLRKAISGTAAMYDAAREMIQPGVNELDVFQRLQAAAVAEFGEMLTGTGNDYQCGSRGGPPRSRLARADELYILDLGPAFRGYFADNARTFSVSGEPSQEQSKAWTRCCEVFAIVEDRVKPGVSARALFDEVQQFLDQAPLGVFNHHLGHGFGLFPHEAPHLNPHWDDYFELGDVFTVEPGLYAPELHVGMRVENDYLVVERGVELLSQIPLELC